MNKLVSAFKSPLFVPITTVIVIVLLVGLYTPLGQRIADQAVGVFSGSNIVDVVTTQTSTTTPASALPVQVSTSDYDRTCLRLAAGYGNVVPVFVYFGNFTDGTTASTTVTPLLGTPVYASSSIEFYGMTVPITQIWATSTVSGQRIHVTGC